MRAFSAEDGQALSEYAVLLGLITFGLIAVFTSLGTTCQHLYEATVQAFAP